MKKMQIAVVALVLALGFSAAYAATTPMPYPMTMAEFNAVYAYTNPAAVASCVTNTDIVLGKTNITIQTMRSNDTLYAMRVTAIPAAYTYAGVVAPIDLNKMFEESNIYTVTAIQTNDNWQYLSVYTWVTNTSVCFTNALGTVFPATVTTYRTVSQVWTNLWTVGTVTSTYAVMSMYVATPYANQNDLVAATNNSIVQAQTRINSATGSFISGGTTVAKATTAGYAFQSTYATGSAASAYAFQAKYATGATAAAYSFQSTYATGAAAAAYAFQSTYATNAGDVLYANVANAATTSVSATTAGYAFQSTYATNAGGAATATYAFQSTYATNAGGAETATYAFQSTYATGATAAAYAFQSTYATNAGNVLYANVANQCTSLVANSGVTMSTTNVAADTRWTNVFTIANGIITAITVLP